MLKRILIATLINLFVPLIAFGAFPVGWSATSTLTSFISPNNVGGLKQTPLLNDLITKGPYVDVRSYSGLAAAITAISTASTTLLISQNSNVAANLTIPANVTLTFQGKGVINVATGKTLTIVGNIIAGNQQLFENVLNGNQGTTSFAGNKSIDKYYIGWWGAHNDFTDDAQPMIQAAINAVPDYSVVYAPAHQKYNSCATINIQNRKGVRLVAEAPNFTDTGATVGSTAIKWCGPIGGTMLSLNQTSFSHIVGWTFLASTTGAGATAAGKVIDIDGSGTNTSTEDWLEDNYITNSPAASTTFKAISISQTALSNNEFMHLVHNQIFGTANSGAPLATTYAGYGLFMGASANAHGHILDSNTFSTLDRGVYAISGSFTSLGSNDAVSNNYDIWMDDQAYPVDIKGWDTENSNYFAHIDGANAPITIEQNRIGASGTSGQCVIQFGSASHYITVRDNMMASVTSTCIYDGTSANSNLHLLTSNNRYPSGWTDPQIFKGFDPTGGPFYTYNFGETGTTTLFAPMKSYIDNTFSYPSMGTGVGGVHLSLINPTSDNSAAITFGADVNGHRTEAQAGIYVQSSGSYGTKMYFGTSNDFTAGSQARVMIDHNGNMGIATITPGSLLSLGNTGANTINISPTATSTFGSGLNLRTGCFAISGVCVSGTVGGSDQSILFNSGGVETGNAFFQYNNSTKQFIMANSGPTLASLSYIPTNAGGLSVLGGIGYSTTTFQNNVQVQNGSLIIGTAIPLQLNGFGTGFTQLQVSTTSNDIAQSQFANLSSGTNAAVCNFLDNDKTNYNQIGVATVFYGGICFGGSNYNIPGFNALKQNGLAVFSTDGPVAIGSGSANTASSSIYFQAGSGLDASYDMVLTGGTANLGISTTTPGGKLSVTNNSVATIAAFLVSTSSATATNTAFVIDKNGKVGIGTVAPTADFQVTGSAKIGSGLFGSGISGSGGDLLVSGNLDIKGSNINLGRNSNAATLLQFFDSSVQTGTLTWSNGFTLDASGSGGASIVLNPTIGKVSIGSSTPAARLSITNQSGATFPLLLMSTSTSGTATATAFMVDSNGRVGFGGGLLALSNTLDVKGFAAIGSSFAGNYKAPSNGLLVEGLTGIGASTTLSAQLAVTGLKGATNPMFMISTTTATGATSTAFLIDTNGRVGINTPSPAFALDVNGQVALGVGITTVYVAGGTVGISTSTPNAIFGISGTTTALATSLPLMLISTTTGTATTTAFGISAVGKLLIGPASAGIAVLSSGTVVVNAANIANRTMWQLTPFNDGCTIANIGTIYIAATTSSSFTISSSNALSTCGVSWLMYDLPFADR